MKYRILKDAVGNYYPQYRFKFLPVWIHFKYSVNDEYHGLETFENIEGAKKFIIGHQTQDESREARKHTQVVWEA